METIAFKYICPLFFGLGGIGLSVIALCGLMLNRNIQEKGGILFSLAAIFFFPPWLCVIIPDALGWIRLGDTYYLRQISLYLGVAAFLFLLLAWFKNKRGKIHGSQVSIAFSGSAVFAAWLSLLPQMLTDFILLSGIKF